MGTSLDAGPLAETHREQVHPFLGELALWRYEPPALGDVPLMIVSGRHVIAERSGHHVPKTESEVILRPAPQDGVSARRRSS
ncbi:hypothetical protein AB0C24_33520 [Amycolatopsis japonica]|uniref:hypothetical protein n=1 Tax=Amycolatopsis japonica TaxID=208439 RepID=UPI003402A15B